MLKKTLYAPIKTSPLLHSVPIKARKTISGIGFFSGLTSGRFHIQRGTGGIILANAELELN
ncbi:MAG: hypothetical protein KAJ40_02970 [Alphaproteobacteria bacterium]|nr:hypothetical protein [Alphaproteobacteria bacterium]